MSISINSDSTSLIARLSLAHSQASLNQSIQRLSSGQRINSAADDAAGLAISTQMASQIGGLGTAGQNVNDAVSLSQTASGGLSAISDSLQDLRQLAVQSANPTNSAANRAALNAQAQQLVSQIDTVASTTQFNGQNLLDGSFQGQQVQAGANPGDSISLSIGSATAASLGSSGGGSANVGSLDISTAAGATSAIQTIDAALNQVTAQQTQQGAVQDQLASAAGSLQISATDLASADSQIDDTDFAQQTASLSSSQILSQAGIAMQAQANASDSLVLAMLGSR